MDQDKNRVQNEDKQEKKYDYRMYPENVRQIGEVTGQQRIYIEDYVLTYIRRVFREQQEQSIVVFVGKAGREAAEDAIFLYGALEIPFHVESDELTGEKWNEIYRELQQYFPGGNIMGWGFGVGMWSSKIDQKVRRIQEEQFSGEGSILFLADLSEREEKLFLYDDSSFEEMTGYFVYYERNPQMQDYMLREQKKEDSFEASYDDQVTKTIRTVIEKKKTRQEQLRYIAYGAGVLLLLMILFGANLLIESLAKINSLEETIEALSGYVTEQQEERADVVISRALESTDKPSASSTAAPAVSPKVSSTSKPSASPVVSTTKQPSVSTATPRRTSPSVSKSQSTKKPSRTQMPSASVQPREALSGSANNIRQSYIVQKGDTLSQIVWRQYHSYRYLKKVQQINQIKDSDEIYEGQCILLPDL